MKKQDFLTAINYVKYIALIAASVCVLVFQFIGQPICVTIALVFYVIGFGTMFISSLLRSIEIFDADKLIKQTHSVAVDPDTEPNEKAPKPEMEVVDLGKEKFWSIFGAIFFALFTVFTFVVLLLY